jgi:rhodanese-related sulfurtransferase
MELKGFRGTWLWTGLFALLLGSAAGQTVQDPYPDEISVSQAREKQDADVMILDVREPGEWQQGHIPGSTLIPLGQLESRVSELPQDKEIVVVCRSGGRSATGRDILKKAGFKKVSSMAEGMNAWTSAGYPTTK